MPLLHPEKIPKSHGLTVSHETVPLSKMNQWDRFLSGDNNSFAFFVSSETVTF